MPVFRLQTTRKENNWKTEEPLDESSCKFGNGTDQTVQSLMFMMMMTKTCFSPEVRTYNIHLIRRPQ